ncbi:hypothetical protein [Pyrococcus sp. NA2]|uniref:hypothetical protein n=1 Tax=Pyrococcus sp. (strain NA2) TaxID=342949 RepID=UPI00064E7F24|nr:hypothetical protein [Pyrococcus sp. NA2]
MVNRVRIVVGMFYALFILFLVWRVFLRGTPPLIWDQAIHFIASVKYYNALMHFELSDLVYADRYYPPLPQLFAIPGYIIFGPSVSVGVFTLNAIAVGIMLYATYKISKLMRVSPPVPIFMILTSPIILDQATTFMMDITLTSIVVLTWYRWILCFSSFGHQKY